MRPVTSATHPWATAATRVAILVACAGEGWGCKLAATSPPASAPSSVAGEPAPPAQAGEIHQQVASAVFAALCNHDFDEVERHFDAGMREAVPKDKVALVWSRAVAANGELVSWALTKSDRQSTYERLHYDLTLESGHLGALVTFPMQGDRIAGMLLLPLGSPRLQ